MTAEARQYEHLKNNVKSQSEYLQHVDKRLIRTETQFEFVCKRLDSIEDNLIDLTKTVQGVRDYLNEHKGGLNARNKMWIVIYSSLTIAGLYGLHLILPKLILRLFGVNI